METYLYPSLFTSSEAQLPDPLRGLLVVAADCVGGFFEYDHQFLCLFIPLILFGAVGEGRGSLHCRLMVQ